MKNSLERKLMKEFAFLRPKGGLKGNLMYFGIMTDSGWYKLLYDLCKDIQRVINNTPDHSLDDFTVIQVKEKFGTLRFSAGRYNEEIGELIDKAEKKSASICEICGSRKGQLSFGAGWYKTVCPKCGKKEGYRACPK